jgi:hypothetical protein
MSNTMDHQQLDELNAKIRLLETRIEIMQQNFQNKMSEKKYSMDLSSHQLLPNLHLILTNWMKTCSWSGL